MAVLLLAGCAPAEEASTAQVQPAAQWEPDCSIQAEDRDQPARREELWVKRKDAEPLCLFSGAMAWAAFDQEKAAQLYALAMVRRRYDIGRCVRPPGGPMSSMMAAIRMGAGDKLQEAGIMVGPATIRPLALDPATYRYRTDHLAAMCEGPVKPSSSWPDEEAQMRREIEGRSPQK
jgi:hypothetical protein